MANLLHETKEAITESGHVPHDITFIGSQESGHCCTWDEFCKLSNEDYEDGFGAAKVAFDLIVVFDDGQTMWRGEYDGSEWWEFSKPFTEPVNSLPIHRLLATNIGWDSLAVCNEAQP